MPTYDYECRACGEKLEIFHSMTEVARKKCPKCGKSKLERMIGAGSGFIFKGTGFYITDYRSSDYQARAKADSGAPSDSKSASTTESKSSPVAASSSESSSKSSEPKSSPEKTKAETTG